MNNSINCDLSSVDIGQEMDCQLNISQQISGLEVMNTFNFYDSSDNDTYCSNLKLTVSTMQNISIHVPDYSVECESDDETCTLETCISNLDIVTNNTNSFDIQLLIPYWSDYTQLCPESLISQITITCTRYYILCSN